VVTVVHWCFESCAQPELHPP